MSAERRGGKGRAPRTEAFPRGDHLVGLPGPELLKALARLNQLLLDIAHPRVAEVADLLALADRDPSAFWRAVDANAWWAGAGSLAAETLSENPGLGEAEWQMAVREFRELLAEIGEALMARGESNPGISSWVLAFRHWNASGV